MLGFYLGKRSSYHLGTSIRIHALRLPHHSHLCARCKGLCRQRHCKHWAPVRAAQESTIPWSQFSFTKACCALDCWLLEEEKQPTFNCFLSVPISGPSHGPCRVLCASCLCLAFRWRVMASRTCVLHLRAQHRLCTCAAARARTRARVCVCVCMCGCIYI